MKALLLLLVLVFALSSCSAQTANDDVKKICLIKQNGILVEKRSFDDKNNIVSIITYDEGNGKTPIDSIIFDNHLRITVYSYDQGKYLPDDLSLIRDYYTQIYDTAGSTCILRSIIQHKFLIEDVIESLCSIQGSVLVDGTEVSTRESITKASNGVTIRYSNLNSIFNNLPEILQSYFYNQPLDSLSLFVNNGYLQKETYSFSGGLASRSFTYDNGLIQESILEVQYANSIKAPTKIVWTYELR